MRAFHFHERSLIDLYTFGDGTTLALQMNLVCIGTLTLLALSFRIHQRDVWDICVSAITDAAPSCTVLVYNLF